MDEAAGEDEDAEKGTKQVCKRGVARKESSGVSYRTGGERTCLPASDMCRRGGLLAKLTWPALVYRLLLAGATVLAIEAVTAAWRVLAFHVRARDIPFLV